MHFQSRCLKGVLSIEDLTLSFGLGVLLEVRLFLATTYINDENHA